MDIAHAILATLAFFSLYDLPVNQHTIHQFLYQRHANFEDTSETLAQLVRSGRVVAHDGLYGLKTWNDALFTSNRREITKRWRKVDRYFWLLSIIPYIDFLSIINSLAFGNAHQESDIDFFVVTKPHRLYFVRTLIILIFRALGVYKTHDHVNERFCFGFYITTKALNLAPVLLENNDPHFAFWFASFAPIINKTGYKNLVEANPWIYEYFPNFDYQTRIHNIKPRNASLRIIKAVFEIILYIPAVILEPLLRSVHIRHTFKLPENHWETSTTIANESILKLHALDPRKDIRARFNELLRSLR